MLIDYENNQFLMKWIMIIIQNLIYSGTKLLSRMAALLNALESEENRHLGLTGTERSFYGTFFAGRVMFSTAIEHFNKTQNYFDTP